MRQKVRDNGLSLVTFGLFVLFLLGHSMAGYYAYNADQHEHQQLPIRYAAYLVSSHFWATVFENWESEFLQMGAYVILTVFLGYALKAGHPLEDSCQEVKSPPYTPFCLFR